MYASIQPIGLHQAADRTEQGVEGCGPCTVVLVTLKQARQECNKSQEADMRVRFRRHMREAHGQAVALFSE
jgi:hypothetical protein